MKLISIAVKQKHFNTCGFMFGKDREPSSTI